MTIRPFVETVKSILVLETWKLFGSLRKHIEACYTKMLRMALKLAFRIGKNGFSFACAFYSRALYYFVS